MRRLIGLALAGTLLLMPAACRQRRKHVAAPPPESQQDTLTASMVSAADPRAAAQFAKGFYTIENDSWRWTAKEFSVSLGPPRGAAQSGAQLVLEFAVPDVVIQRLNSVTLTASIGGKTLAPEVYKTAGAHTYIRDVPAAQLQTEAIPIDFALDKALPATAADSRELGIIVSQVGFKIK
jgi:hypothetical protein